MFRTCITGAVSAAVVALSTGAFAQQGQFGSAAGAKAMEERVITELKANETAALAKFNKIDGGFRDRDLFVFCFNTTTGIFSATPFPALMGTDNRLLTAIMHGVAHFSGLLSERVLVVRPAGSV
jgi:hypothetical protein